MARSLRSLRRGLAALLASASLLAGGFDADRCVAPDGADCEACPAATAESSAHDAMPSPPPTSGEAPSPDAPPHPSACDVACAVVSAAPVDGPDATRAGPWHTSPRADRSDAPASATRLSDPPPPKA